MPLFCCDLGVRFSHLPDFPLATLNFCELEKTLHLLFASPAENVFFAVFSRDESGRHSAAFLEVVPKASKHEMLVLSPEMTVLSDTMRIR